jgi:NAD(P)-dependent dehydrogenase (short-subunit alcohol dehydrogenase family)
MFQRPKPGLGDPLRRSESVMSGSPWGEQAGRMADFLGGSVAIVAGGEGGIGRASAVRLAELSARVAVLDRDLDGAAEYGEKLTAPSVRDELRDRADDGLAIQVDLADSGRTQQAIDDVADRWGRLDSLVIPAGGAITPYPRSAASATSDEDFQALVDTNMRTVVNCHTSHAEVRRRGDRDHGEQRGTRGFLGRVPRRLCHDEGRRRAALPVPCRRGWPIGHAGQLHRGRRHPHRPGCRPVSGLVNDEAATSIPLGRQGEPSDIADAVQYLVSPLSAYIAGQVLAVDGGSTLR